MVAPVDIFVFFSSEQNHLALEERLESRSSVGGGRIITRCPGGPISSIVETARHEIGGRPLGVITESEAEALGVIESGADEALAFSDLNPGDAELTRFLDRTLLRARNRFQAETERHELAQAEKLSSLGTLIAGVGHELNNPLSAMMLGFDVLSEHMIPDLEAVWKVREKLDSGAILTEDDVRSVAAVLSIRAIDVRELLGDISEAAGHVVQLVQDLRVFSRSNAVERPTLFQPRDVIEQALRLVRREFGTKTAVEQDYEDDLPELLLQRNRLAQVLTNLLANAAHAVREVEREVHRIRISARRDDDALAISIADTGPGISDANLKRIFDPFFTTKKEGRGTGLGLSISRTIVRELGGDLDVSSVYGEGATFVCFLPLPSPQQLAAGGVRRRAREVIEVPSTSASILLVDDDENVLRAAARTLAKHYKVIIARDGEEAKELLQSGSNADAVVCELELPELDGPDFIGWLTTERPSLAERLVIATAAQERPHYREFLENFRGVVLHKPLGKESLLGAVAWVLQNRSANASYSTIR